VKIVLSIDGGGVRGIIPVAILNYLERRIQDIQGDSRIRLGNLVDFVAGTSSGAVLGALMLLPSDTKSPWAKLDMIEITDIYMEFVENFFSTNLHHKIKSLWGYHGPKYPLNLIEESILKYFNHYKMENLIKPCIITGYDISKREIILYTNLKDGKYSSYYIKDILKSAVATPSLFQPGYFHEGDDINTVIHGDLFSGNPSMLALTEAPKDGIINSGNLKEVYFLSIGTGLDHGLKRKYPYETVKNWGKADWLIPIIDIVISSSQDSIEKETRTLFESHNCLENYHRINPPIIHSSGSAMDHTKDNLMNSIKDAIEYIEENKVYLEEIANKICRLKYLIRVDD
jgi:uncharacterized protein